MEVSKTWFEQIRNTLLLGKDEKREIENPRAGEECAKKTFILHIQSWVERENVEKIAQANGETEGMKVRKSYLLEIKQMLFGMRKCEIYQMLIGLRETKNWFGDKMTFAAHGNPGCEIWFIRFIDLSGTGGMWELNEEGRHLEVTRNEEDYHQLARRFGRYKSARTDALGEIRYEQMMEDIPDKFIGCQKVRKRVLRKREKEEYSSETEEKQCAERKGAGGKKGDDEKGPNGKAYTQKGEGY